MSINELDISVFPPEAFRVIEALESAGHEAWIVGGCVRDIICGRPINDVDIASSASWEEAEKACLKHKMKVKRSGTKHGTITVLVPSGAEVEKCEYQAFEVTTYRIDSPTSSDSRHPDSVTFTKSIEEDLARRDFTMNAIAWHPERGLLDPFDGARDIESRIIRVVGDPNKRFSEDALRILRACRFASQLGFDIDAPTFKCMCSSKSLLLKISSERITAELGLLLMGDHVHDAIMKCVDVLSICVPELMAMKGFEQKTKYHIYDVLEHTAWVVQYSKKTPLIRWAAFCHDMGKPACSFFDEKGTQHFYGHAYVGERITKGFLERMSLKSSFKADVCALVANHNDVLDPSNRSVKRMLARLGGRVDLMEDMIELKLADMQAHAPEYAKETKEVEGARVALARIIDESQAFTLKQLAIDGNDLIAIGVPVGPDIGSILDKLLDEVIEGSIQNDHEALSARAKELIQL